MTDNVVAMPPRVNVRSIDSAEILELSILADLAVHVVLSEMDQGPISPNGSPLPLILHDIALRARVIKDAVWCASVALLIFALCSSSAFAQSVYDVAFSINNQISFTGSITANCAISCSPVAWSFIASDGSVVSSTGGAITNSVNSPLTYNAQGVFFEPDLNAGSITFSGPTGVLTFNGGEATPADAIGYGSTATTPASGYSQVFSGVPDGQPALTLATAAAVVPVPMSEPRGAIVVLGGLLLLWRWHVRRRRCNITAR